MTRRVMTKMRYFPTSCLGIGNALNPFRTTPYQDVRKRDITSDGHFHGIEVKFQLQIDCGRKENVHHQMVEFN